MAYIYWRNLKIGKEYQIEGEIYKFLGPYQGIGLPEFAKYSNLEENVKGIKVIILHTSHSVDIKDENKLTLDGSSTKILKPNETEQLKKNEFSRLNKILEEVA